MTGIHFHVLVVAILDSPQHASELLRDNGSFNTKGRYKRKYNGKFCTETILLREIHHTCFEIN